MATMKKFWMYFWMFIGFFLFVTILTNFLMRDDYKNGNYEIKAESLTITVSECKAAYSTGYIKGSVTNNTGKLIPLKYLQIDLYNKDGVYLGSEYKELKNWYPEETINFDMSYNYLKIDKTTLDFVDEIPEKEGFSLLKGVDNGTLAMAGPIAALLVVVTVLP